MQEVFSKNEMGFFQGEVFLGVAVPIGMKSDKIFLENAKLVILMFHRLILLKIYKITFAIKKSLRQGTCQYSAKHHSY